MLHPSAASVVTDEDEPADELMLIPLGLTGLDGMDADVPGVLVLRNIKEAVTLTVLLAVWTNGMADQW